MRSRISSLAPALLALIIVACGGPVLPQDEFAQECQDMPSLNRRINCFTDLALERAEPDYCSYIIDAGFRVTCQKLVAKQECNVSLCDEITESWKRDGCRAEVRQWMDRDKCGLDVR